MLELAGTSQRDAAAQSKMVLDFEAELARSVMPVAEKRDPEKTTHVMDLAGLRALAPNFDWAQLMQEMALPESIPINVTEPKLLKKFNAQLTAVPVSEWRVWLHWRALKVAAPYLPQAIAGESFHFEKTVLAGTEQSPPRWETCAELVDQDLSDTLGQAYVEKYFPPEAKRRMSQLVENLRAALCEEIERSEWMEPETKKNAIAKLNALQVQIGYPDRWHDYSDVACGAKIPSGSNAPAAEYEQSSALAIPRDWDFAEHAGVPPRLSLQARRRDGAPGGAAMQTVVAGK
jgi:putative endopeptidase